MEKMNKNLTIQQAEEAAWGIELMKNLVFFSIISADNMKYSEETKQEVMRRYELVKSAPDWEFILDPLGSDAEKYMKILGS